MRRVVPMILIGLGAFLLVAALMIRFYVYPKLAVVPRGQDGVTQLEALDATVIDRSQIPPVEMTTDLKVENATRENKEATDKEGGNARVWAVVTSIRTSDDTIFARQTEQVAYDATTAEAINCCGNFVAEENPTTGDIERKAIERSGIVLKFPFNTQKQTYDMWDSSLQDTVPAKFVKEDTFKGLPVYVFNAKVEPTTVGTQDIPGSMVDSNKDTVTADMVYTDDLTLYIEPNSGAPVNRIDKMSRVLRDPATGNEFTAIDYTMTYTDAQSTKMVEDSQQALMLGKMRGIIPLVSGFLGLLLLGLGIVMSRRHEAAAVKSAYEDDDDI